MVLPTGDLHHADLPQDLDLPGALQLSGPHTCSAMSERHVRSGARPAEPMSLGSKQSPDLSGPTEHVAASPWLWPQGQNLTQMCHRHCSCVEHTRGSRRRAGHVKLLPKSQQQGPGQHVQTCCPPGTQVLTRRSHNKAAFCPDTKGS